MPPIYQSTLRVEHSHLDPNQHVNNVVYVQWMQDVAIAHSTAQGWPTRRLREENLTWVARTHHIDYHQPAFEGDEVVIQTWVADMHKTSSTRIYRMTRASDQTLLVTASTNWILLDTTKHRPTRIPPDIRSSFEIVTNL